MRTLLLCLTCALLLAPAGNAEARAKPRVKARAKPKVKTRAVLKKRPLRVTRPVAVPQVKPRKKRIQLGPLRVSTSRQRPVMISIPEKKRHYTRPDLELKREAYSR